MLETQTYKKLKDKPKDNFPAWLIVHHTGGTDLDPKADTSHHTAAMVEKWHIEKGWEGIGYTYFIEKDGKVWAGRPEHYHGAHTEDYNAKSIGICLAGNFDVTFPTKEQQDALRTLLVDLRKKYSLLSHKIVPHRKFANKTCYGTRLRDDYAELLALYDIPEPDPLVPLLVPKSKLQRIQDYLNKV